MKIQSKTGRSKGEYGYTLTCFLQSKYNSEGIKSASITIHSDKTPKQIMEMIKNEILCKSKTQTNRQDDGRNPDKGRDSSRIHILPQMQS